MRKFKVPELLLLVSVPLLALLAAKVKPKVANPLAWECTPSNHVIPRNDLKPHVESADCWCRPFDGRNDSIVHNSMDQRERYEPSYGGHAGPRLRYA